jgi:hypothetical protein
LESSLRIPEFIGCPFSLLLLTGGDVSLWGSDLGGAEVIQHHAEDDCFSGVAGVVIDIEFRDPLATLLVVDAVPVHALRALANRFAVIVDEKYLVDNILREVAIVVVVSDGLRQRAALGSGTASCAGTNILGLAGFLAAKLGVLMAANAVLAFVFVVRGTVLTACTLIETQGNDRARSAEGNEAQEEEFCT